jgi:hypothetical protein
VSTGSVEPIMKNIIIDGHDPNHVTKRVYNLREKLNNLVRPSTLGKVGDFAFPASNKRKGPPLENTESREPPTETTMKQVEASVTSWVNTTFTAQMLKLKYDAPTHLDPKDARTSKEDLQKQVRHNESL